MNQKKYNTAKYWLKSYLPFYLFTLLFFSSCVAHKVPQTAQAFIEKYFPDATIVLTEKEEDGEEGYSVWLNDGTKIDFDLSNEWKRVNRKRTGVPEMLIPSAIQQYLKTNYPDEAVFKISRKTYGYKITLSNDHDLKFTPQGKLIELDE